MIRNLFFSFIAGAAIFFTVNFFLIDKWERIASYDILLGGLFEFFILQAIFFFHGQQQSQKMQKHLAKHLDQIEKLVKSNDKKL